MTHLREVQGDDAMLWIYAQIDESGSLQEEVQVYHDDDGWLTLPFSAFHSTERLREALAAAITE
jgi:hypothetical protein